jgi:RimJ/RimL family protein N-acetyltransferase
LSGPLRLLRTRPADSDTAASAISAAVDNVASNRRFCSQTTPRLLLREFRLDDHAAVHAFASDPEVVCYTDWGPNDPEETTAFLHEVVDSARATPRVTFAMAVVDRSDDMLIGSIELVTTSSQHRRGEIGYVFCPTALGRGFATEAAIALMRFGFDGLGMHKISATCDPANVASAGVGQMRHAR